MSKSAVTVTGLVPEDSLGITLPHEHVLIDFTCRYRPAEDEADVVLPALAERWRVLREPAGYRANLDGTSVSVAAAEVNAFKASGGTTIVDLSVRGLGADPEGLVEVAEATGVNIIAGTGTYVAESVTDEIRTASVEALEQRFVADIEHGGRERIRRGVIGEIGIETQSEFEMRAVVASARAQARTGAPCYLHVLSGIIPATRPSVLELLDLYEAEGGDLTKLVLCHQDGSGDDLEYQKRVLDRGAWFEYDTFGFESVFGLGDDYIQLPTDSQRIRELKRLIDDGYQDQLLISHDICYQMMRRGWGGWGYAHLLDVLPGRFRAAGIDADTLRHLMVGNPARLLCFAESNGAA